MGHITHKEKTAFNQLLTVDVLRGKHSTGVALVDYNGNVDVFKKAVNVMDFLDFKTYSDLMKYGYNCLLGHNRYATKGGINNVNAHPFEYDNVVGMHNGTLRNYVKLDGASTFDVDSECLYSHLNDNGIQDTVNKITGAYALTWFDKTTNKLHFLRNDERPLCYCYSEDGRTLFWASEAWMLHAVLGRNDISHKDVFTVTADTLYAFDVPQVYQTATVKLSAPKVCKMVKPPVSVKSNVSLLPSAKKSQDDTKLFASYINTEVEFCVGDEEVDSFNKPYISAFVFNDTGKDIRIYCERGTALARELMLKRDFGNFKGHVRKVTYAGQGTYLLLDLRTVEYVGYDLDILDDDDAAEEVGPTVKGFHGVDLSKAEFEHATSRGCAWCGHPTSFGVPISFVRVDEFICDGCKTQPDVIEWINEGCNGI